MDRDILDAMTMSISLPRMGARAIPLLAATLIPTTAVRGATTLHDGVAISAAAVNAEPTTEALARNDAPAVLRAQILLDRAHFSSGVLNGQTSDNLTTAVTFFQQTNGLAPTGQLDSLTYATLVDRVGAIDGVVRVTLSDADMRGPYLWVPADVYEQARLPCECYASALEMLDERYHTVTAVLLSLNPGVSFRHLSAGEQLWVPNVEAFDATHPHFAAPAKAVAVIQVHKRERYVQALAADGSIVFHFPTTVGSEYDPSPSGVYHVESVMWDPAFHYDPTLYSDVPDSRPRATLAPGPNSPVGMVWIATTKAHVGIHGTPLPFQIGLNNSHGCIRLTNWDASRLAAAVHPGVPIVFVK
jgi:lipoprotein-anchoring transpeptidase ErfK/SrfK